MTYFISGSNHAGEITGLALSGNHVGVAACEVNEDSLRALERLAPSLTKVFVDSGAFSEVTFPNGVPTVTRPISPAEWNRRLDLYERLARTLRRQLYVVAPDCVAHQLATLVRLEQYAERVRDIAAHRTNVIVPVQKGQLPMGEFHAQAEAILGIPPEQIVWGIPMKKDATSINELAEFAASLHARGSSRIHLLGLGPKSPRYAEALAAVLWNAPTCSVSCDSVRITALVGRTNGPGGGPRALTAERDRVLAEGIHSQEWMGMTGTTLVKYTMVHRVFTREARTEAQEMRRAGWFDDELESAPGVPLEPGCIDYGPGGPFGSDDAEPAVLEAA